MIANSTFRDAFTILETFERGLNLAGYVPVVGPIAGALRQYYSNIEAIAGIALAILSLGMKLQEQRSSSFYLTVGITLIGHAILNYIRSCFEEVSGLPLVTTLPYDLVATFYVGGRFFSYQHLMAR